MSLFSWIHITFLLYFAEAVIGKNCSGSELLAVLQLCTDAARRDCQVTAINITDTSALLMINIENKCSDEPYSITYSSGDQQVSEYETNNDQEGSHLLMDLVPNSTYAVRVCTKIERFSGSYCNRCCTATFNTSNSVIDPSNESVSPTSQIINQGADGQDLRVTVFAPLLNTADAISAQIVWDPQHYEDTYTSYNISITEYSTGLEVFYHHKYNKSFVNVQTYEEDLSPIYPLERNKNYLVEVTANTDHNNNNKSHFNTSFIAKEYRNELEYIVVQEKLLLYHYFYNQPVSTEPFDISLPIALDKINRVVYYWDNTAKAIYSTPLDYPSNKKLLCSYDEAHDVIAMTFDWISRELYLGVKSENNQFRLLYFSVDDSTVCDIQQYGKTVTENIIEMNTVINPFSGRIYWTQRTGDDDFSLKYLNLSSSNSTIIEVGEIEVGLDSLALGLDVRTDCLYIVESCDDDREIHVCTIKSMLASGPSNLCDFSITIKNVDYVNSIAVSEAGIFVEATSVEMTPVISHYDHNGILVRHVKAVDDSVVEAIDDSVRWFDITSPGTQPLPEQACLSPRIAEPANIRLNPPSANITWNPNLRHHPNCKSQPFSFPPVTYKVTLFLQDGTEKEYFTNESRLSVNVPIITNISVQVITDFSVSGPVSYLQDIPEITMTSPTQDTTNTNTPTTDDFQSRTTVSPSQSSVGEEDSASTSYGAVIGGVAGGVTVIVILLVLTIVILSLVLCAKSKKSNTINNNTTRYVQSNGTTNTAPRYTTNVHQGNPVPAQSTGNSAPLYEPLSTSLQSNNNHEFSNDQYATPVDSLEPYRSDHRMLGASGQSGNSLGNNQSTLATPYAIPADSLEQYRNSQIIGSPEKQATALPTPPISIKDYRSGDREINGGQEYEVPLSLSQHSDHNLTLTPPTGEVSPDSDLYSTVDDAKEQKQQFHTGRGLPVVRPMSHVPPSYNSLYKPNGNNPTEITEASQLYSEPITSSKKSSKTSKAGVVPPDTRFRSATLPHNRPGKGVVPMVTKPFDNPVYDSSPVEPETSDNHAYSVLDNKEPTKRTQSSSNYSKLNHKDNGHSTANNNSSEPTYFELVKTDFKRENSKPEPETPDHSSSDYHHLDRSPITRTRSNPPIPSSYHQLGRPSLNPSQTRSKTKTLDNSEPTYHVLEKPAIGSTRKLNPDSQTSNPEPAYSVLEHRSSRNPKSTHTKPEPTYFEVERPTTSNKEQLYFQVEQQQVTTQN